MVQFFCLTVYMHTHKQAGIGIIMYINCIYVKFTKKRKRKHFDGFQHIFGWWHLLVL